MSEMSEFFEAADAEERCWLNDLDRFDNEDEIVDRLMVDDEFYDRVVGWF